MGNPKKQSGEILEVAVPYFGGTLLTDELTFTDKEGPRRERILIAEISLPYYHSDGSVNRKILRNARANIKSIDYHETATSTYGPVLSDTAPLKWAGLKNGEPRDILPGMTVKLDILAIRTGTPGIFLHTQQDVIPRESVCHGDGEYSVNVVVHSDNYPPLEFVAEFNYHVRQILEII